MKKPAKKKPARVVWLVPFAGTYVQGVWSTKREANDWRARFMTGDAPRRFVEARR